MEKNKRMRMLIILLTTCFCGILAQPGLTIEIGTVDIHGFISQGYLHSSDFDIYVDGTETGTFEFNELGINFSSYLTDKLLLGTQFLALDFGNIGNDEVIIDWAYAGYHWKDWAGLRVGIIKIPHGFYNETRDIDMLRVGIFLPNSVYTETFRDAFTRMIGGGLYGSIPGGFSYQFLYGISDLKEGNTLVEAFANRLGGEATDSQNDILYVGNLQWESLFGLRLGVSYLAVDARFSLSRSGINIDITPAENYAIVGSAEYIWDRLILAAEYAYYSLKFNLKPDLPPAVIAALGIPDSVRFIPEGWYVSAAYAFTDWFMLGIYHSQFTRDKNNDPTDPEPAWLRETVFTTRFDVNSNWIIKLEYHLMKGLYFNTDGATNATEGDPYWNLFAAKVSFNF